VRLTIDFQRTGVMVTIGTPSPRELSLTAALPDLYQFDLRAQAKQGTVTINNVRLEVPGLHSHVFAETVIGVANGPMQTARITLPTAAQRVILTADLTYTNPHNQNQFEVHFAQTPEPGAFLLTGAGVIALVVARKRVSGRERR
jgi:hypothetical protein